ncbi:polyprotein [Burdock mosaic virus]|nr:polyprotein [Burdock mosaic virus]
MFSTLRNLASKTVAVGGNLCDTVEKTSSLMTKLDALDGPFSDVIINASSITERIDQTTLPMMEAAVAKTNEGLSSISKIFSMLEKLLEPLMKIHGMISSVWKTATETLFSIFGKCTETEGGLVGFLTAMLPEDVTIPVAIVVFIGALLILKFILPSTLLSKFIEVIGGCVYMVKGFVVGLLPKRFTTWFAGFFEPASAELVAQGPSTFGTETSGFGLADILASVVSMGFVSLLYSMIGTEKPGKHNGNPISTILCATGDHAQKMNHLFTFFKNVKTTLGDTLLWVGEWICEVCGFGSPLSATVNMVLNTKLFQWFNEVNAAVDPLKKLENFANPQFVIEISKLKDQSKYFEAEFAKYPVSPFVTTRFNSAVGKLDKLLDAAHAHKGVGNYRNEPYCLQFYGSPGCGKTMSIGFMIEDLLNRLDEPKTNRLYSLSSKDGYWSNYNHQVAVLIDDFGQIVDAAGQNDGVKDLIFMKSSAPMSLPMAAVEEKGTQFTSKYIFLTSNYPTPLPTAGIMDLGAVQRRRNMLVHVSRHGPIDETCETPVDNLLFTVCSATAPFHRITGMVNLTYKQLLDVVEMDCKKHWSKDSWLQKFQKGLETPLVAQATQEEIKKLASEFQVSSLKYAYRGSLNLDNPFPLNSPAYLSYPHVSVEDKFSFHQWKSQLLCNSIVDGDVAEWLERVDEKNRSAFTAWIPFYAFDEERFMRAMTAGKGTLQMFVTSDDPDALDAFSTAPQMSQFAYAVVIRHYNALKRLVAEQKPKPSYVSQIVDFIKRTWENTPYVIKVVLQIYVTFKCASLMFDGIKFLFGVSTPEGASQMATAAYVAEARSSAKNISGDEATAIARPKNKIGRFLTAQSLSDDWAEWAKKDPFTNEALIKNMVVLRLPEGPLFRGVYVQSGWILTVAHPFIRQADGFSFTVIHQHSMVGVCLNKGSDYFKLVPDQDLVLIYVGDIDGMKKDIKSHFALRHGVLCSAGSKGALIKPVFDSSVVGSHTSIEMVGVSMLTNGTEAIEYKDGGFTLASASAYQFQYPGKNGDCGSVLLLPSIGNRQPVIGGIHCAGMGPEHVRQGNQLCCASAIYREDLEALLPKPILQAQVQCSLLKQLRAANENPFPIQQVALVGVAPPELAINVPHKTTLRKSEIFQILGEKLGEHTTEPSILVARDGRAPEGFDPYIKGVEKFNETACYIDMNVAEIVMQHMENDLLLKLKSVEVPGGKPTLRSEVEVLNGIPGEMYYDAMDMSTACGYPFTLSEHGKSKRGYIDGEAGSYVLHRERPVYPAYCEMEENIVQGKVMDMISCECAKDERLPLEKIYQKPKTRLFTILPFHYNMLVRKYFLDFSASLMRAHNDVPCKVGINPEGLEWTRLARGFLEASDLGFSADYSSFDGRAPVFIFQRFCDMVDRYYGDSPRSSASLARHALLMMASQHHTICGDKVFRVVGGMPSGFSLTVLFNSLLNEFYMRYAFEKLLRHPRNQGRTVGMSQATFQELFVAIYGDDNLVAVPLHLRWYSLPAIAEELGKINVVIKNGLDKNSDVSTTQFQPLGELTFLSRGFKRHQLGFFLAPLKWVSIIEPLRWIRPSPECPAIEALRQNIEGSLRAAFMHGRVQFNDLRRVVIEALTERCIPYESLPFFEELERQWLSEVTQTELVAPAICDTPILDLPDRAKLTPEQISRDINEFVPGVYFCSSRTAKQASVREYIIVNCMASQHKEWVRGPTSWIDLENKIWAYTMSAIEMAQQERRKKGLGDNLLFVCSGGNGISVVCGALAAMACSQYTKSQVIVRYRHLTGCVTLASTAGGAGHYLTLAAQQGAPASASRGSCDLIGSSIYDRCLRLGNCRVLTGISPPATLPGTFACSAVSGTNGVKTTMHYIQKEDPLGHKLAGVLRFARQNASVVYLFFSVFRSLEAEWILNALKLAGENVGATLSADLLLLERQARLIEGHAYGRIVFDITRPKGTKGLGTLPTMTMVSYDDEMGKRVHNGYGGKQIPVSTNAFSSVETLQEVMCGIEPGRYYTTSVVEALKLLKATNRIKHYTDFANFATLFFPVVGSVHSVEVLLSVLIWANCSIHAISSVVPDSVVEALGSHFKYVVKDPTAHDCWPLLSDFTEYTEEMSASLFLNYSESAIRGHKVFRLSAEMPSVAFLIVGTVLENVVRRARGEVEVQLPAWFPEYHHLTAALTQVNFNYV